MDIFNHVPTAAVITDGNGNEKKILRTLLAPNTIYLIDAGYAEYKLLGDIIAALSSFVIRLILLRHIIDYGQINILIRYKAI